MYGKYVYMAMDLFSSFDDHNKVMFDYFFLVWGLMMGLVVSMKDSKYFVLSYWKHSSLVLSFMSLSLVKNSKLYNINGSTSIVSSIFFVLLVMNFHGVMPYTMGLTSHLAIAFSMAFPLWFSMVLLSSSFNLSSFLAHLLPAGSPAYLIPFLCLIEMISMMIRPLTLTVRVVANLSTGHILIGLLAGGCVTSSGLPSLLIILIGALYMIFEMAVCVVQAYIFTLLPTLYGDEHTQSYII